MRICYITNGAKMGHYHYAQNLLNGLSNSENITIDTFYIDEGKEPDFQGVDTVRPLATSTKDSFAFNVICTLLHHLQFVIYLIISQPEIIHFNTVFRNQYHTYALARLGKLTGARIVRTVHEVTAERLRNVSAREKQIAYRHLKSCDQLIVHSEHVREDIQAEDVETPTTVLPHGNYLFFREHLDPDADPPLPIDDKPVIMFFGPKQHKGIDIFAGALTKVETTFTTWIAGPIADDAIETVSQLESSPHVYVDRGYIPDEKLPDYFDHADIVVLPYHSGTTSGAVHLARAFKTAVVTSPLPCFTDVVEHRVDGYILNKNTPETLTGAIDELVTSPEVRRKLATVGYKAEQSPRFDWGRIGKETAKVYNQVSVPHKVD